MYSLVSEGVIVSRVKTLGAAYTAAKDFVSQCRPVDVGVQIWKRTGTRVEYLGTVYKNSKYMEKIA